MDLLFLASWHFPDEWNARLWFLALGLLSILLQGVAKSGFGGSVGLLSVPLMIYACGGDTAAATAVLLPLLIAADYGAILAWWRQWRWRILAPLIPGMLVGVGVGGALLAAARTVEGPDMRRQGDAVLKLAVGVIALAFVAQQAVRALRRRTRAYQPAGWHAPLVGALAGTTSTLAHAAGPVAAVYLLPQQLPKGPYVATTAFFFWMLNQVKLVPYFGLGMIDLSTLAASALLLPAVGAGVALGVFLNRRVGPKSFAGVVYTLLALAGGQLCHDALRVLLG